MCASYGSAGGLGNQASPARAIQSHQVVFGEVVLKVIVEVVLRL